MRRVLMPRQVFLKVVYLKGYALWRQPLSAPRGCHLGAWCLHFGPWGIILAPQEHLGGPCEQQDGLERVRHKIFIDFEVILLPFFESFLGTEA